MQGVLSRGLLSLAIGVWVLVLLNYGGWPHWPLLERGAVFGVVALFVLIPLWAVLQWLLDHRRTGPDLRRRQRVRRANVFLWATWLLSCLPVGLYVLVIWAASTRYEERTEGWMLPSGDMLFNHTYVTRFRDVMRVNTYRIRFREAPTEEDIGTVYGDDALLEKYDNIALVRHGEHIALVVGRQVFKRWRRQGKPWWYRWEATLDPEALAYIQGLRLDGKPVWSAADTQTWRQAQAQRYVVESLDLATQRVTIVANPAHPSWPSRLAYMSKAFEYPWAFDPERTTTLNPRFDVWPLPADLSAEYLLVTVPHDTGKPLEPMAFAAVMQRPGATIALQRFLPLDAAKWQALQVELGLPNGQIVKRRVEIKGAWGDWRQDTVSLFLRYPWTASSGWSVMQLSERKPLGAEGYAGTALYAYLRVFRKSGT